MQACLNRPWSVLLVLFLIAMAVTLPGCQAFDAGIDAIPITADQADVAADGVTRTAAWLPAPWNYAAMGLAGVLTLVSEFKRRRAKGEASTLRSATTQIVGSVKHALDLMPLDERHDVTTKLASKQDANTRAVVREIKTELAKSQS